MAIKMRNNTKSDAICCECGESQKQVLNMFDLCVGGIKFTICDECNLAIFNKTLHAEVLKNGRVKSPQDMRIIAERDRKKGFSYTNASISDALKDIDKNEENE